VKEPVPVCAADADAVPVGETDAVGASFVGDGVPVAVPVVVGEADGQEVAVAVGVAETEKESDEEGVTVTLCEADTVAEIVPVATGESASARRSARGRARGRARMAHRTETRG
jgi:hypothetical protein